MAVTMTNPSSSTSALPRRPGIAMTASMLAIAAGVMLFGGLLASYFGQRGAAQAAGEAWLPEGLALPNVALATTYLALVMSAVTAQWAVSAIKQNDRLNLYWALGTTLFLAFAFINGLTFCWRELGLVAASGSYAALVYAITVTHLLVVIAAIAVFVVMGFRALGGQFSPRNSEFVASAAAFWHFAVAAGFVVYVSLWFLEGAPK
ncbi:MAG: cytochrome c oxidase subunit 3 [Actinobacteria bacterium]|nr:cytochrome c oxidase subunit 3 [Actinomycetota bacterium]MBI3257181.1 cytochrome c oxidase subunit 3 [Actinomycetota bacterium]